MNADRLPDYLDHIQQAATDACDFVQGTTKEAFLGDKRTQQAVVMSLIIIGEAGHQVDGGLRRVRTRTCRNPLARHARDAQPDRTRLLRYQPGRGLGHGADGTAATAGAAHRGSKRQRRFRRLTE